jgi:putative nucleotidyltransferase with HDIG domain
VIKSKICFKDYRRALVLFTLTACIILLFLPRAGKFKYEFQKGKPWNHENLLASFDFPIYKSQAELLEEQKQINTNYNIYYTYDPIVEELQLNSLKEALPDNEDYSKLKDEVLSIYQQIYKRGILNDDNNTTILNSTVISIIRGNVSEDYLISALYMLPAAYEYLNNTIHNSPNRKELEKFLQNTELKQYIQPNLLYDEKLTLQVKENRMESILPTKGMVLKGDKIISKGEIVTSSSFQILTSLKKEFEENMGFSGNWTLLTIGQFLFVIVCLAAMFILLLLFRHEMLSKTKNLLFLLVLINLVSIAALLILRNKESFIYFIPFTIVPIYITTFFYSRPALFVHWMLILMIGNFVPNGFEFVYLNSIAGVVAIWSFKHLYKRGQLFSSVFLIYLAYIISYLILKLIQEGSFTSINWFFLFVFFINSLIIITLYQFTFVFEKLFGFLSDSRLVELSDTNQKLLRELAETAPGTFQHSMQVANLAEAAIREIGGNVLLVRTGALYHDIGKMKNPIFFIENQSSGHNPHDGLTPEESTRIIIEHVTYGIKLAHKFNLPESIIDFIRSHHGKSKVYYFYSQYKTLHPGIKEEDIAPLFTYPGFNPHTKEMAVVMIADSVEAASRSLKEISIDTISNLIDKLVGFQLAEGYFNDADITFAELSVVKKVLKHKLQNIYHGRIEYPEMKSEKENQ